jgi:hypothetical protein
VTTINEDASSWNASGVLRRDFRSARSDPETGAHRSRKPTSKWCKGKAGLPHVGRWQEWDYSWMKLWNRPPVMVSVCVNCGKRLDMMWPPADTYGPSP